MELQASHGQLGAEGDCEMSSLLLASPQSEAVTYELEELSLQPLPPLNERKNVLQLRLQQRRTREQLVEQGIMPPLKSPAAFHGQIRSLERARTENFLKHKIRSRPERAELVRMHILQETGAEPSLQATQMRLKRARLADNLNEMLAQRPGPMELVEKNILPVDSSVKQAIIVGQVNYPKVLDEDSSDALSPEQPASQESQNSVPSPVESKVPEMPSPAPAPPPPPPPIPTTMLQQSQQKPPSEKSRSKKGKEPKSRVKKLKYHQYVPPDQKQEASEAPMDSSYARLLQQQQLFLQLQILSQQQQHYNYQTILPAPLKPVAEGQSSSAGSLPTSIVVSLPTAPPPPPVTPAPVRPNNSLSHRKPGVLPANLEEMKVAELKLELKLRGLPVSGTKTDLIEKLKPYQDNHCTSAPTTTTFSSMPMEVTTTTTTPAIVFPVQQVAPESINPTPPVSPIPTDRSTLQQDAPLPSFHVPEEKDRRLHEKEQQIVELMRKLEQEQRLVEELKMQLEVEKRGQGGCTADSASVSPKLTSVPAMNPVPTTLSPLQTVVKLEDSQPAAPSLQQFFISHPGGVSQVLGQPQTLLTTTGQAGRILLPVSLPKNAAIQLPSSTVSLQTLTMCNNTTGLENQTRPEMNPQCFLRSSPENRVSPRASPNHNISNGPVNKVLLEGTGLSLVPTATSQQMDDLFDILIQSGEITPFIQQDPHVSLTKTIPVTASISTLPVNTALSRPPPQIQVAPPPTLSPIMDHGLSSLSSLATDNQLEAFLENTLAETAPASDPRTQGLMEELQAQLMEQQPYSPMDTSDLSFCDSSSPSSLNMGLSDPGLDNMEWLDLTMPPGPAGALTPLGIPTDFLDTQDLQLHWD
uniref:Myocardin related transcription factor B n=1 Tax=Sander lucioperca TaxID=283035 RepID=A0A8C9XL47_SANLU